MPVPTPKLALADDGIGAAPCETLVVAEEEQSASKRSKRYPAHPDGAATPTTTTKEEEESAPAGSKTSYECRFCLMRFEKSQALGGHMNRHRQEREKEQYQQAQELLNSHAQQQMPRHWTSFATEISQLPADLCRQFTGGVTRPHAPPISFNPYNRGQAQTSASNPSMLLSNYQQHQHHNGDGFSKVAALPRSGNYAISTSLQTTVVQPELFADMFRASATTNNKEPNNINNNNINDSSSNNNNNINDSSLYSSYPSSFGKNVD